MQAANIAATWSLLVLGGVLVFSLCTNRAACLVVGVFAGGGARFESGTEDHRLDATLQLSADLWRVHERCLDIYEVSHVLGSLLESVSLLLTEALLHNQTVLSDRAILDSLGQPCRLRLLNIAVLGVGGQLD